MFREGLDGGDVSLWLFPMVYLSKGKESVFMMTVACIWGEEQVIVL